MAMKSGSIPDDYYHYETSGLLGWSIIIEKEPDEKFATVRVYDSERPIELLKREISGSNCLQEARRAALKSIRDWASHWLAESDDSKVDYNSELPDWN